MTETPESCLDAIRDHPEWTASERAEHFDRMIRSFEPDQLRLAVRDRIGDLTGNVGEVLLHLIDALDDPGLFEALAEAIEKQPDLPADRMWEALKLLLESGVLDAHPELSERWDELAESLDEEASLDQLVEQIEDDGVWVALHGLGAIEPEIRAQIISGVAKRPLGPGLIEFLRLLAYAHDPVTRTAALDALASQAGGDPRMVEVWATIAADHPDPDVSDRARRWLGAEADTAIKTWAGPDRIIPHLTRSLVTAFDGQGRRYIVLEGEERDQWTAAAFLCDVTHGVVDVIGQAGPDRGASDELFTKFRGCPEHDAVAGATEMALDLLAESLSICNPQTTPELRYWIERTIGPLRWPRPSAGAQPAG